MTAHARQPDSQLAGQGMDRLAQGGHLLAAGVHEVDVFGQGLAQSLGHGFHAPVGHQPPADLGLYLLLERLHPGLELVVFEALLQLGHGLGRVLAGLVHEALEHRVQIEVPQRAVQVVGAPHRAARLHAREAGHGLAGKGPHQCLVAPQQGLEEHLGQLFGRQLLASPAGHPLHALHRRQLGAFGQLLQQLREGFLVQGVLGTPQREVDLEDRLERTPVGVVLHQGGTQGVLEGLAILEGDVGHRLHGVEVLGEADRQTGLAQLHDEARQQLQHGRGCRGGCVCRR